MKRLLESIDGGPVADKGRELLRGLAPMPESEEHMLSMRRALEEPRGRTSWIRRTPVLLAATLVLIGASSAAAVRSEHFRRWIKLSATPATTLAPRPADAVVTAPVGDSKPSFAPNLATPDSTIPLAETRLDEPSHLGESAGGPPPVARGSRAQHASASDVALIHDAAKALRHDRDPERAARLLDAAGNDARGPLAEEALALRIEAALAKKDPKAKDLGKDYLARYPQGRYRVLALQALRGSDG